MVRPFGVAIGVANKEVIQNNVHLHGKKKVEFSFVRFFYGVPVQSLHNIQSFPVLWSQTRPKTRCGLSVSNQMCSII
jgi:hypothetical protein